MGKTEIKKGDIYYAALDPIIGSEQNGTRPVVVVQNNLGNKYSPTVVIAPITTSLKKQKLPTHLMIENKLFLKSKSMILLEQLRVVDKKRLREYLGSLDEKQIKEIDKKLSYVFGSPSKEDKNEYGN